MAQCIPANEAAQVDMASWSDIDFGICAMESSYMEIRTPLSLLISTIFVLSLRLSVSEDKLTAIPTTRILLPLVPVTIEQEAVLSFPFVVFFNRLASFLPSMDGGEFSDRRNLSSDTKSDPSKIAIWLAAMEEEDRKPPTVRILDDASENDEHSGVVDELSTTTISRCTTDKRVMRKSNANLGFCGDVMMIAVFIAMDSSTIISWFEKWWIILSYLYANNMRWHA